MSIESHEPRSSAIEDMLADLGLDSAGIDHVRTALTEVRHQATEVPVASPEVVALLQGATPLRRPPRRRLMAAAAVGALAFGGASAAAATNHLPGPIQEVVAKVTGAPHPNDDPPATKPVKPTRDSDDEKDGDEKDASSHGDKDERSGHDKAEAPGQIRKATTRDSSGDGPAKPADPGSHGRTRADDVRAGHTKGDPKKTDWKHNGWGQPGWTKSNQDEKSTSSGHKDASAPWNKPSKDKDQRKHDDRGKHGNRGTSGKHDNKKNDNGWGGNRH